MFRCTPLPVLYAYRDIARYSVKRPPDMATLSVAESGGLQDYTGSQRRPASFAKSTQNRRYLESVFISTDVVLDCKGRQRAGSIKGIDRQIINLKNQYIHSDCSKIRFCDALENSDLPLNLYLKGIAMLCTSLYPRVFRLSL